MDKKTDKKATWNDVVRLRGNKNKQGKLIKMKLTDEQTATFNRLQARAEELRLAGKRRTADAFTLSTGMLDVQDERNKLMMELVKELKKCGKSTLYIKADGFYMGDKYQNPKKAK